ALALLLWYAVDVLVLVFAGILVAVLLRGLADWVGERTKLSEGWSLAVVIVALTAAAAVLGWLLVPEIAGQINQLTERLPGSWAKVREWLGQTPWGKPLLAVLPQEFGGFTVGSGTVKRVTGIASTTLNVLLTAVLVGFLGLFLASEPNLYIKGALHLVPKDHRPRARQLFTQVGRALAGWLLGQGIDMVIIGVLTAAGLWVLGVPLWLTLGLLAGLTNFIPNFGPIIAFIPAALIALTVEPSKALWVAGLFVVLQSLEGYVLLPFIQRRTVSLPPALTILAQVLLGVLMGPLGVVFATPLMAAALVVVKMLYVRDVLGDPVPVQPKGGA
ncbi:MAG TPA: AI-2E family transporter, partial [Tepidisphaeraceae bacterium]|nr:AI-2E family transporter [Tepidisphaeraceae bacterium]